VRAGELQLLADQLDQQQAVRPALVGGAVDADRNADFPAHVSNIVAVLDGFAAGALQAMPMARGTRVAINWR
jgi:hypothetical protein